MRILVVEDEKQIADFLKTGLEGASFVVDVAQNGDVGSFFARTNNYDLLILDNKLPGKSGRQICLDVRDAGLHIPILILSVQAETVTKIDLLNVGADDYLIKPFSFEELLARVRALLRRPEQLSSHLLCIDNLTLDIINYRVSRGDAEIRLRKKEFTLLRYMMKNQDIVLSRAMLMEHVWDMTSDPLSNTIDTHIRYLRMKIDAPGEKKLFHTVPGVGYKLSENP